MPSYSSPRADVNLSSGVPGCVGTSRPKTADFARCCDSYVFSIHTGYYPSSEPNKYVEPIPPSAKETYTNEILVVDRLKESDGEWSSGGDDPWKALETALMELDCVPSGEIPANMPVDAATFVYF